MESDCSSGDYGSATSWLPSLGLREMTSPAGAAGHGARDRSPMARPRLASLLTAVPEERKVPRARGRATAVVTRSRDMTTDGAGSRRASGAGP